MNIQLRKSMILFSLSLGSTWLDETWKLCHIRVQMQNFVNIRLAEFVESNVYKNMHLTRWPKLTIGINLMIIQSTYQQINPPNLLGRYNITWFIVPMSDILALPSTSVLYIMALLWQFYTFRVGPCRDVCHILVLCHPSDIKNVCEWSAHSQFIFDTMSSPLRNWTNGYILLGTLDYRY